jgi:hypothetical protein
VFNDAAVAARLMQAEWARQRRHQRKPLQVAIIDLDVHQGNGTASIFAGDASVFTLSLHGQKNFPFRKEASDLDVDLPDGCGDAAYLQALEHALDELERRFEPGLILFLAGADPYVGDRLGRLALSFDGLEARDRRVFDWAWQRRIPLAFSMAGGYGVNIDETVQVQMNTYTLALEYWARWNPLAVAEARLHCCYIAWDSPRRPLDIEEAKTCRCPLPVFPTMLKKLPPCAYWSSAAPALSAAMPWRRCMLARMQVAIGSRHPERHEAAYPFAAMRLARFEQLLQPDAWAALLKDVDVVVNCVGILRQRPNESYDHVHHRAPAALALACARAGIRFIHTSALGLHEGAKSRFLSSKLLGERAIAASGSDYAIVRPSLLDGEGGFGARWLRGLSRSPVHCIPRGARGGIAAMTAADLGLAFAALAAFPSLAAHRESNWAALAAMVMPSTCVSCAPTTPAPAPCNCPCPTGWRAWARMPATSLHFSPFSYGHWILLQRDNILQAQPLPELLGREPHAIGSKALTSPAWPALAK